MTVKEILGSDLALLQEAGLGRDEIISIAKSRKVGIVATKHKNEEAAYQTLRNDLKKQTLTKSDHAVDELLAQRYSAIDGNGKPLADKNTYREEPAYSAWRRGQKKQMESETNAEVKSTNIYDDKGQTFLDRVERGAVTTGAEIYNIGRYVTGKDIDPTYAKVVEDGRAKDKEFTESLQNDERKAEVKKIEDEYEKSDDTWSTTKAGAKLLYDKASNPSEWNMGGVLGEMVNPVNFVGLGSGKVVSALGTKALSAKMAQGAAVGAIGQGALNAGYEYTADKSLGKSDKEAKKAALMGALSGASMGGVMGGFAGAKVKAKLQEKHGENYSQEYNDLLDNELMQLDEVDAHAVQAQPIMEDIAKTARTPQEFNEQVISLVPPQPKEIQTSLIINNNQEVSPRLAGSRVRNALVKSIENPRKTNQEMVDTLVNEGFTVETANAITTAYHNKDVTIFDDFVAHKMSEVIDVQVLEKQKLLENKDVREPSNTENGTGDATRAESRANESLTPARGDNGANAEQTSLQQSEPRGDKTTLDAGQHTGENREDVGVPKGNEGVDGHETVNLDGSDVSRTAKEQVVQDEVGLRDDGGVAKETQADRVRKASELPIGGSEDEAKARVKALFRKKEKPKTYDKEELQHHAESYFKDTFSDKELENAIAHLPKDAAKKVIKAKNGKIDENSIEVLENLRREGFPHMDEEIGRYEKLTDKYFSEEAPTPKEEAEIGSLESELKDYFNKEEYIDARTKRKELETVSNDKRGKSPKIKRDEPQESRGASEVEVPRNDRLEDVSDTDVRDIKPQTKGERKAINAQVEELIKKPIDKITPEDKKVLENYTGKGGLESGTKESLTQHYTDDNTISAMYKALDNAGVPTKTALEPAVGSGNFLKNRKNTKFTTIDIDGTNHEVVKRLYQDAEHHHSGYEAFKPSEKFDLVISNVPFSEERGVGRLAHRSDVKALHDHFFIKALEDVKDDGVIAFITSKGVMDKANSKTRKEITAQADVVGAYRLPDSTFKHTHTQVVTDVIFLQKRPKGAKSRQSVTNELFTTVSKDADGRVLNDYYKNFPDRVLGDMKEGIDPMYGKPTYLVTGKADLSKMKINYRAYGDVIKNKSVSNAKGSVAPTKGLKTASKSNRSSLASKGLGKPFGLKATKDNITLDSALAYDFRFKTKYISEMNNNGNIFMLDATPTPNKPLELFTMLKHLDDKIFDEYNIRTDEDFVNQFLETGQVQDKNGKFKDSITGIKNVFELRSIMDRFIDRISMQEFKDKGYIDIPESETYKHIIDSSDESDMVFSDISERLAEAKSDISKRKDVLGIFSNGVSASVDPRLYKKMGITELAYRTAENNKINAVVDMVADVRAKDKKAGQIIFVDSAGQNAEHLKYNLHQEVKTMLIKKGYKKDEVAIISGQEITVNGVEKKLSGNKMSEQKQQVVNDYNEGKVKVVIGTTKSAGEGMNIQKFTTDIYHLDLPWTPAEITQRNGRGVRYGNKYKKVGIHYFFTQGSFDDLMFNTITKKQGWNDLIWDAEAQSHLKIADSDGGGLPSADEIFLSMEKDPIKRKELELGMQHQKLEDELMNVEDELRYASGRMPSLNADVTDIRAYIKKIKRDIEHEVVDTESLKELQKKAIKNDKKFGKKFDEALAKRQESRKRWLKQQEARLEKALKKVESGKKQELQAKEDFKMVEEKLEKFEGENVGDDGKYLSGIEGC